MTPSYTTFTPLQWILSLCVAGTFIGHGLIAVMGGEPKWYNFLAVAGIGRQVGGPLMRAIGTMDIAVGICAVLWPHEGLLVWAALWGLATALVRPLAGESPLAAVERCGNFLPAVAFLVVNTEHDHSLYSWGMVAVVLTLIGSSLTLLLRQSRVLADPAPAAKRSPAKAR